MNVAVISVVNEIIIPVVSNTSKRNEKRKAGRKQGAAMRVKIKVNEIEKMREGP